MVTYAPKREREIIKKLVTQFDQCRSDSEGEWPHADTGCPYCTVGTVPDTRNTGLCPYHTATNYLADTVEY